MADLKKLDLLVNVARLYYEHNCSQQTIAEKLGISRPYVSRLISEARESGIVEIKIIDPNGAETQLEREMRTEFGLEKALVIPYQRGMEENLTGQLAAAACRYLNTVIKDNDIIGVSWGATLYACSRSIKPAVQPKNITVVQLCGAVSMLEKNIYAGEIPINLAAAYRGVPYLLPLPAVVDDINTKTAITRDKNISHVLETGRKADIAIFSVGTFTRNSTLPRAGYISPADVDRILARGAEGDICSRIIDGKGEICDGELDGRTIGISLEDLRKIKCRIGVAGGPDKVRCIHAILAGGYPNVLVTDEETATGLLKLHRNSKRQ